MDSNYTYAPVYAPTQPPDSRPSFNPLATSQSLGPNVPVFTPTLPPLSNNHLPFPHEHSAQGVASSQAAYAPINTATSSSYSGQSSLQHAHYQRTPRSFQSSQPYQSLGNSSSTYRPYLPATSHQSTPHQSRLAEIRPMPLGGLNEQHSTATTHGIPTQNAFDHMAILNKSEPIHVVGSQGRRGILPSANGRPVAVASTSTSKSSTAGLKKDPDDGKWPCDHCNKRYLHAKHLKRHLLRRKLLTPDIQ